MVPLDPATAASGCLYVAAGFESGRLPTDERGRIEATTADVLVWQPLPLEPGDLLFFDSYTPHHSDTNTTARARQGGTMSQVEVEAFERRAHHEAAVLMRRWDDRLKIARLAVPELAEYRSMVARPAWIRRRFVGHDRVDPWCGPCRRANAA